MYLFLNDVSGSEILLILLFILIFFGSKSIPGIARTMGRTMRQIQDATSDIQQEIKKSTSEYKKDLNLEGIFKETTEEIKRPLDQMVDDLDDSIKYTSPARTNFPPNQNVTESPVQPPSIPNGTAEQVQVETTEVATSNENAEQPASDLNSKKEAESKA